MNEKFHGVFPALLTPFTEQGKVNDKAIADLVAFNVAKGVDGFYVGGSTGEGLLLTVDERKQLFAAAAKANAGRTTMIAHVGTICTEHAIELARCAQDLGYDAISAVAPYYYSFGYDAVKGYYNDIADSVDLPMILYNFPAANGFGLTKERAEDFSAIRSLSASSIPTPICSCCNSLRAWRAIRSSTTGLTKCSSRG